MRDPLVDALYSLLAQMQLLLFFSLSYCLYYEFVIVLINCSIFKKIICHIFLNYILKIYFYIKCNVKLTLHSQNVTLT